MSLFSCQSDGNIFCPRQVCPSSSPAADHSLACAALLQPGRGFRRGEVIPRQALPPLPATSSHLEGNQGCLRKPPSIANHHCHPNCISTSLPPPSFGSLASGHPALRLRQSIPGAHQTLLSPDKKQIEIWQKKCVGVRNPPEVSCLHWVQLTEHQLHCAQRAFSPQKPGACGWVGGSCFKCFDQKHFRFLIKNISAQTSPPPHLFLLSG